MTLPAGHPRCDLDRWPPIQRTLAIPLIGRAMAHRCFPDLGFRDRMAECLEERVHFGGVNALRADRKIVWGTILRTQAFDEVSTRFAAIHPQPTIVSLGVGLCTRASRLHEAIMPRRWVEVDVPDVIEARNALLPTSGHTARFAVDVGVDASLVEVLERATPKTSAPVLVLAEGLLMFLDRKTQLRTLATLERCLPPGSWVAFDYIHPIIPYASWLHASLRATGARYRSGWMPRRDLRMTPRLVPSSLQLFEARLHGRLRTLHRTLSAVARSPLYEIACVTVESGSEAS